MCEFWCAGLDHLDDDVWELLKPDEFFEFAIPFEMHGDTKVSLNNFCHVILLFVETCYITCLALRIIFELIPGYEMVDHGSC